MTPMPGTRDMATVKISNVIGVRSKPAVYALYKLSVNSSQIVPMCHMVFGEVDGEMLLVR